MEASYQIYKAEVTLQPLKLMTDNLIIEEIKNIVIENTGVTLDQLNDRTRKRYIAKARQLFQYLAYNYTSYSLLHVGQLLKTHFDHSTILNSIDNIQNILFLKNRDSYFNTVKNSIELLEAKTKKKK
jgi:chromosomal replication initiation ATPase DnaA